MRQLELAESASGWQVEESWTSTRLNPYYSDLVVHRGHIDGFSEIAKMSAIEGKTWNYPVIVDGVLYVRNGQEMATFQLAVGS